MKTIRVLNNFDIHKLAGDPIGATNRDTIFVRFCFEDVSSFNENDGRLFSTIAQNVSFTIEDVTLYVHKTHVLLR